MIVTADAIVLRTMKYRETSLLAVLYTRGGGKISVIAKGARDGKSRLGPSLQPMNHVTAVFYRKESRDLQLLTQCDILHHHRGLSEDMERMAAGMAIVELTEAVTPAEEENPSLFDLLAQTLAAAGGATKNPGNALYYFEMRLLENLGFRPDVHRCYNCGTPVDASGQVRGLHMGFNGILCADCSAKGLGLQPLSAPAVRVLQRLQEIDGPEAVTRITLTPGVRSEIAGVLRRFLLGHVEGLRTLRSEAVFSSLL
jgi:DNA repair protein RecO (recombination protein O)